MQAVASAAEPPGFEARLTDLAEPRPQDDEVVVEVRATALNRADLLQLRGLYPPPPGEPESPGLECAGEILEIGAEVRGWRIGDRVMALLGGGGHAERVAVPAGQLLPVPVSFSWVEAAALPEAALTAWTNLVAEGGLRAGETVLITGASGGVGSFAVQLAHELGATVVATGRSLDRLEELWRRGADHLLADDDELPERLRLATGRGADLVFDTVSGGRLPSHLSALADQGRLVLVGLMAGARVEVDLAQLLRRRLRVIGSVLRSRPRLEKAQLIAAYAEFAADRMADGRLRPLIAKVVPFDRIAEAYAAMESGGLLGKIVVERSSG
jgi:putative PIG3 family NAD(P)H quinone oxidoreductase